MRRDIGDTGLARVALDNKPEALARQMFTMMIQKEGLLAFSAYEAWTRFFQIALYGLHRHNGERQQTFALLLPIAPWTEHGRSGGIEIRQVERNELGGAHTCRVERVQHRQIAQASRGIRMNPVEQAIDLLDAQRMRQIFLNARGILVLNGTHRKLFTCIEHITKEGLERGDLAGNRRGPVSQAIAHLSEICRDMFVVNRLPALHTL